MKRANANEYMCSVRNDLYKIKIPMTKKRLHVLQVTGAMNRGGAEVMLMDIYRHISKEVYFNFLVNYKVKEGIIKGDFDDEIIELGGNLKYIGAQWDIGLITYIKEFKKICNEIGTPDVVHIHLNAKCGVIALAAKIAGIKKIIAHSHADLKFRGSFLHRLSSIVELKFQKLLIALFATDYWGCSQEALNSLFYKKLQKEGKSAIIKNAVDVSSFQNVSQSTVNKLLASYKHKKGTLILGNIGRIVRHKNVDFIIDILKELETRKIDFRFVFAGRADDELYLDEIFRKAKKLQVTDKIVYLGNRDDVPVIVNTFDIFVSPALREGFGLVAVEAQAAGVPCVLYTGFPKSVDMNLSLVTFLDNFNVQYWVNEILKFKERKNINKIFIQNQISELGFDSIGNTKKIEKLYRS